MQSLLNENDPIVHDARSKATLDLALKAAKSRATVLLEGETGVGKEVLARFIHQHSTFATGPFVSINCAAIPENMVEAILFGYEKGAFTNAINSYAGKFEQADGGTLLLDEISEIPLSLQAKLLRVLQEKEVERLCGKKSIPINARIIVATNKNLEELVANGTFRNDLFYRLNVLPIYCAPLRERPQDIIPLAEYFIRQHAENQPIPVLTREAKEKLLHYTWPGNIREMDNIIQRALVWAENASIQADDLHISLESHSFGKLNSTLKINEAKLILDALKEFDGSREDAAKKLNMSPRTLRYKISRFKLIGLKVP